MRGRLLGVVVGGVLALSAATPARADANVDHGRMWGTFVNARQAALAPCAPTTDGSAVCFPKKGSAWRLTWEHPSDGYSCGYAQIGSDLAGVWSGECMSTIDEGDHVKVWGTPGHYGTPFTLTWSERDPDTIRAGYWTVADDGNVRDEGPDTHWKGDLDDETINQPLVGMASNHTGRGYWLVARDGGVFSFGSATFYGSTGNIKLNQPIVGMASTPTGRGYCLVARDGGVFTFGDATFYGSAASSGRRFVAVIATEAGDGYWLVAADGNAVPEGAARDFGPVTLDRGTHVVAASGI